MKNLAANARTIVVSTLSMKTIRAKFADRFRTTACFPKSKDGIDLH